MERREDWNRLIKLLHEADYLQQKLLGDEHSQACYEFHSQLNMIADDLENFANSEGIKIS